ncbi:MAG: N-acetylmuramoyl-L-alanine amidase [Candidatus Krumholzibacteria bacterium]|nr:N-acetylmuramoyl-L-alanine amidase [Candidatus Krumholzibacteria bacterium]
MALFRRASFAVVIAACLSASAAAAASAAAQHAVRAVRFWTAADHTRVVIDMSAESRYSVRTFPDPERIVIDIPSCVISRGVKDLTVRDGVLDRIRVNRLKIGAQVVLDLRRSSSFSHFPLKAAEGKPHRIVVDIAKTDSGTASEGGGGAVAPPETGATGGREIARPEKGGDFLVVIDPGHGGAEPGCVSRSGIREKTLNLRLAKMLKAEIEKRSGYRAILVRDGDYDVNWVRRVTFAREKSGDVFVSLHFNSNKNPKVRGLELYLLSLEASDENAAAVAERENLLFEAGADSAGFNDDLKSILFDVSRASAMQWSSVLADEVASVVRRDPPIPFNKVKQASLIVLRGLAMPSILVEGGYLSNRKEAAVVATDGYLNWLAKSLAEGIVAFLEKNPRPETANGN